LPSERHRRLQQRQPGIDARGSIDICIAGSTGAAEA